MQQPSDTTQQSPARHWFGLIAGPAAWSTYFVVIYSLSELVCKIGFLRGAIAGISTYIVVTLLLGLLTLAAIAVGARSARRAQQIGRSGDLPKDVADRYRFSGESGLILSAAFALATLLFASIVLLLPPC